ncbi:hypothetical protein [Flavobacterium geliluteum]|uniref:TonB-dependent receptor plug domain-containing protein n=1 Tax=Flavobacterium geliluteum TaxID=2816120 RepID=A0A940X9Q8_9FLAO|nr:hypothetical protein [Flavobacterium geliluteum]MBP4138257.1 hypothetical protein [Flavobacterium geliluteum]
MDNQDKLFDKFKEASHNAELKDFSSMEKVWSRVEEKLDKKEDKKTISLWKKIAVAASLLLVISLGSQFLKSDQKIDIQSPEVVIGNKSKDEISKQNLEQPVIEQDKTIVSSSSSNMIPKAEASQILDKQINQEPVAIADVSHNEGFALPVAEEAVAYENKANNESIQKEEKASASQYLQAEKKASFESETSKKQVPMARKSAPLVVLNGNAMSHSDDAKKDKMMQEELPNLSPANVESLVILDEPLYIIDGIYYSENDLFGNNPTSPYAPLDKQEIKTITILQDLEATSKYGDKGKKGVVIITTKNGKPALKK